MSQMMLANLSQDICKVESAMLNMPFLLICGKGMVEPLRHVKLKVNKFLKISKSFVVKVTVPNIQPIY